MSPFFPNYELMQIDGGDAIETPPPQKAVSSKIRQLEKLDQQEESRYAAQQASIAAQRAREDAELAADKAAAAQAQKEAKIALEQAQLAADRAEAAKAQLDAKAALEKAQKDYQDALEAQARARQAQIEAEAEAARKKAEEDERRRREQQNDYDYSPSTVSNTTPSSPVSPLPLTPSTLSAQAANISPVTQTPPPPPVKTAPIDTILFDEEAVPIQIMSDLIFENIGGQELINIARNDTVNGQQIIYQPIKNLTQIQQQYNPNNIVSLQATSDKYFQNFSIKFDTKVPTQGGGPNGEHVYIDPETGELVVEAVNLSEDEQIEVEITTGGTIYEAEL